MEYSTILKRTPATHEQLADAVSRPHRSDARGADGDDAVLVMSSNQQATRGDQGSVLDGIPVSTTRVTRIDDTVSA